MEVPVDNSALLIGSFIVYSLFIVGVGLYSSRRRKDTTDDFVLANRELGPWAAALSASASAESGWVMIGLIGEAFIEGMSALWIIPGIAAGYLFNWFVVADRLRKSTLHTGAATLPQYICNRYGRNSSALRWISVAIITLAMLGYVAAQMNAAGKAFEAVFHLEYYLGVLAGAVIIFAYTITGGFRAICWTDVVQAGFMMVALIGMPIIMLAHLGGWDVAAHNLLADSPDLLTVSGRHSGLALLGFIVGYLGIGLGYPGQPHVLARFMASRDTSVVHQARWIAFVWMLLVYVGAIIFGVLAHANYGSLGDPEQALPLAVGQLLPAVLGGFVIAAIVAAICSTADSQLIVVSSIISRDVIAKGNTDSSAGGAARFLRIDRITLTILGVIAVLAALTKSRVVFEFVLYAWSALGAAFGPVVILGLLWKRATKAGAVTGMIVGVVTTIIWYNIPALHNRLYELVPAFILSFLSVVIVSLATRPDPQAAEQ